MTVKVVTQDRGSSSTSQLSFGKVCGFPPKRLVELGLPPKDVYRWLQWLKLHCNSKQKKQFWTEPHPCPHTAYWFGSQSGFSVYKKDSLKEGCTGNFFPSVVLSLMGTGGTDGLSQQFSYHFCIGTTCQVNQPKCSFKWNNPPTDVVSLVTIALYCSLWTALTSLLLSIELVDTAQTARRLSCWNGLQAEAFAQGLWKQLALCRWALRNVFNFFSVKHSNLRVSEKWRGAALTILTC